MEVSGGGGGGGGIHALCEDALAEILVRLPSESVLRCSAVCRSWRRVAADRSFLAAHAARRPREMIVYTEHGLSRSAAPLSLDLEPAASGGVGRRRFYLSDPRPLVEEPVFDGLLVLQESRRGLYIICNPITEQWTNLPVLARCSTAYACGFYFHTLSGEYRLLCHGVEEEEEEERGDTARSKSNYYYVLSAGSTLPRRLTRAPSEAPGTETEYGIPVSYRGSCTGTATGKMLAFDTVSETFRLMSRPPGPGPERPNWETMRDLLVLEGELSVATKLLLTLDIWVLQDYEAAERWTLRHRVTLPRPTDFGLVGMPPMMDRVLSVGRNAILIACPSARMARLYDLKEKRVSRVIDFGGDPTSWCSVRASCGMLSSTCHRSPALCHQSSPSQIEKVVMNLHNRRLEHSCGGR
ncbi:F-box protein [Panicum miliaceum]|uniref:F-box protein n=1 Tax=Panicum miliaceum TaxID=4540 RepID=A0A3L6T164_PANMI|nr:F-box protein [Panicum miliaceum]